MTVVQQILRGQKFETLGGTIATPITVTSSGGENCKQAD